MALFFLAGFLGGGGRGGPPSVPTETHWLAAQKGRPGFPGGLGGLGLWLGLGLLWLGFALIL